LAEFHATEPKGAQMRDAHGETGKVQPPTSACLVEWAAHGSECRVMSKTAVNLDKVGYPAVRRAFNQILQSCFEKLTKAEVKNAYAVLNLEFLDANAAGHAEMLADTAIFSAKAGKKRAIDRIAPKLASNHDPLVSLIAARLPSAVFSIFAIRDLHEQGGVVAHDLLDSQRPIQIMDKALAAQVAHDEDVVIAGRFVDLGPWYIGFGIVIPLRKSEMVAIELTLSASENPAQARGNLHELFYTAQIHDLDLVMMALEPLIAELALAIDTDALDPAEFAVMAKALLAGVPAAELTRKARLP
jgi:hypothetical protein